LILEEKDGVIRNL